MTQTLLFGILIFCASYTIGVDTYNDDVIDTLHEVKIMDHISIPQHDLILGTLSCQSGTLCADTKNEDHVLPRVVLRDNSVHDDELMYHPEDHPEDHHDHHHDDNDDHHDDDHHDDHDHDHEKKDLVPLRVIKGIGAANLFIMSMVFGYAPRLLKLVKHQWVSYINVCFFLHQKALVDRILLKKETNINLQAIWRRSYLYVCHSIFITRTRRRHT